MRNTATSYRAKLIKGIALAGFIWLVTACSSTSAEVPDPTGEEGGGGLEASEVRISGIKAPGTVPLEYAADEIARAMVSPSNPSTWTTVVSLFLRNAFPRGDSLSLMETLEDMKHPFEWIGIGGYPEVAQASTLR